MDSEGNIQSGTLLNTYWDTNPAVGETVNLYYHQGELMREGLIDQMFCGWQENGTAAPWTYVLENGGRHVLEPIGYADIPDGCTVELRNEYWLNNPVDFFSSDKDNGSSVTVQSSEKSKDTAAVVVQNSAADSDSGVSVQNGAKDSSTAAVQSSRDTGVSTQSDNISYYQTLTDYTGSDELVVPKYVQAVKICRNSFVMMVNTITISDTVRYIDTQSKQMYIADAYIVDENNPDFASTTDGILTNKPSEGEALQYLGIPAGMEELTIPEGVEKVTLPPVTALTSITIEESDPAKLPDIDSGGLEYAKITVPDESYGAFCSSNAKKLAGTGTTVVSASGTSVIEGDTVYSKDDSGNVLTGVVTQNKYYTMPEKVSKIADYAFMDSTVEWLVLPRGRSLPEIGADSFTDSNVKAILCSMQDQYDAVQKMLKDNNITNVQAIMLQTGANGDIYFTDEDTYETVLMEAAAGTVEFNGTIQDANGDTLDLTGIADSAFESCTSLKWVTLPTFVTSIGARAFYGCSSLEGVLIDTWMPVTIGNMAFDNCTSLAFIASNSYDCELDGYQINTGAGDTQMYAPTNATAGYDSDWIAFKPESGVSSYAVVDIGGNAKMLYGTDYMGEPWLGLRVGKTANGALTLPTGTLELFTDAMSGVEGTFTINWDELENLGYIDDDAFYNSGLTGSVNTTAIAVGEFAFSGTAITDVTMTQAVQLLDQSSFANCKSLKNFVISYGFEAPDWTGARSAIYTNLFHGCDALDNITIYDLNVPQLSLFDVSSNIGFRFNDQWTWEEMVEKVHLMPAEGIPASDIVGRYVLSWRYPLLGWLDHSGETAYTQMWKKAFDNALYHPTDGLTSEEAADEDVKNQLIGVENDIRHMFGMTDTVEEPSGYYPYHIDGRGNITLAGIPSGLNDVSLNGKTLELLDGQTFIVGTGAFKNSPDLERATIYDDVTALEQNAFAGVKSDSIQVAFYGAQPLQLLNPGDGESYSFGVDDSQLKIYIWAWGSGDAYLNYIKAWVYPLAGYEDYDAMYAAVAKELGDNATEEQIHAEMAKRLLPVENRLRAMMWYLNDDFEYVQPEPVDEISFTFGEDEDDIWSDMFPDYTPDYFSGGSSGDKTAADTEHNTDADSGSTDTDTVDEPTDSDDTSADTPSDEPASEPVVLPMQDGKHEIVIPSISSDSASTEDKVQWYEVK